jgi:ribosomal protein S13
MNKLDTKRYSCDAPEAAMERDVQVKKTHNIIAKLNSCSYSYTGVRVRLGLQRVRGQGGGS